MIEIKALNIFFMLLIFIFPVQGAGLIFNTPGTQYYNLTLNYSAVEDISFNLTGSMYNSSYPSNITLDILDDNVADWEYKVYHSNTSAYAEDVIAAWSDNPDSAELFIMSNMSDTETGVSLGYIQDNEFSYSTNSYNSTLGLYTTDNINSQILSITDNSSTIHAFLPSASPVGMAGFYVAEGGSTYYCNSEHSFLMTMSCNLTLAEAFTPAHLAVEANQTGFNFTEPISNPKIIDSINSELQGCSLPCTIPIKVQTETAGNISFSDFHITKTAAPANISITENSSHYLVQVSANNPLTSVEYFYGNMPNVYVAPVVAGNDTINLTAGQAARLSMLNSSLSEAWDNLTNHSHPMNFTFYSEPFVLFDYSTGENYSRFNEEILDYLADVVPLQFPAVLVVLDIHDYFPSRDHVNTRRSYPYQEDMISQLYINGFSDSNPKTQLYNWDTELLLNVVLHELVHTFIGYPPVDSNLYFYADHPASFTDLPDFNTYNASQSPTGGEGYYEIYSIANQLRTYMAKEDIGNNEIILSDLDKALLGTLSPYYASNYTFYSGNVTNSGNRYTPTAMTSTQSTDSEILYYLATDDTWWDVRNESTHINMGTNNNFSVQKPAQSGKALWVYAKDSGHPEHFAVFSANARSTTAESTTCAHEADTDCSGDISNLELSAYANRWYTNSTDVTSLHLSQAAAIWYG